MRPIYILIGCLVIFSTIFFIKTDKEKWGATGGKTVTLESAKTEPENKVSIAPIEQTTEDNSIQKALEKIFSTKTLPTPSKVQLDVPFTSQAPFGNWADMEQDYGCEEASLLMALYWAKDEKLTSEVALREIKAMSKFEQNKYGDYHDTSITDTLDIMKTYLGYENAYSKFDIGIADIKTEIAAGNVVIVPIDARKVYNVYYTPPGPFRHQIVVTGYDDASGEFITNDPGTSHGAGYRYSYKVMERALMDYPTGFNEPVEVVRTAMIVVTK